MRLAVFVSLLLSSLPVGWSEDQQFQEVQPEGHVELGTSSVQGPLDLPALLDEVKGLKELLLSLKASEVDQRQAQRSLESRLRDREVEAQQQSHCLQNLQEMNSVLKRKVEELEEHNRGGRNSSRMLCMLKTIIFLTLQLNTAKVEGGGDEKNMKAEVLMCLGQVWLTFAP